MQVRPSNTLLHALSRVGEGASVRQPTAAEQASQSTATPVTARGVPSDAARAAARAAFQALKAPAPGTAAQTQAVVQPQPTAPAAQTMQATPAKILPRGSFLNILV